MTKNKLVRLLAIILSVLMTLAFASCGGGGADITDNVETDAQKSDGYETDKPETDAPTIEEPDYIDWSFDETTGTLTISGKGDMDDYEYVGNGNSTAPWNDKKDMITRVVIKNGVTSIGAEAFSGCRSLTSIEIPDSVTSIGAEAFSGCSSLTSISIPDSVTSIGEGAFSGCSLTSISIPDSVTSIGEGVFAGCISLTSISIPDSVTSIGWHAFEDCWSLTSINYSGTKAQWNLITGVGEAWIPTNCTIHCTDGDIVID